MDLYLTVIELIDTRSFTSMWFWIVLAVFWSTISHFVMGVPFDLVQRAQRLGGQTLEDVATLARINATRLLYISGAAGLFLTGGAACFLTMLALLGFLYGIEFCQALFLLALPFTVVGFISQRTARRIIGGESEGERLVRRLKRHRLTVQMVGVLSIFITAFWGIFHAMSVTVLGG